jgi:hypothetical protein
MFGTRSLQPVSLLLVVVFLFCLFPSTPAVAGQEEEKPLTVKEVISGLEAQYKNKKNLDSEKIAEIYTLLGNMYADAAGGDQKKIVKAIRKGFEIKPAPKVKEYMLTGAECLTRMGREGLAALQKAYNSKTLEPRDKDNTTEVEACFAIKLRIIEAMGQTKETGSFKTLFKLLWHTDPKVINASITALSSFSDSSLKDRKNVVDNLVKVFANIYTESINVANRNKPEFKERFNATNGNFNETLGKLTPVSLTSAPDWQKWYNDNKGKKKWE